MPFYEYHCANCGHHHEELQKVTDKPLRKCPACGKNKLNRLISAPVFRLKGGGWYETDFKSDKENKRNLAGEKDTGGEAKSEAGEKAKAAPEKESAKPADKPSGKTTVAVKKPSTAKPKATAAPKKATGGKARAGSGRSK
jgi:putative FmdB family regulatory protein